MNVLVRLEFMGYVVKLFEILCGFVYVFKKWLVSKLRIIDILLFNCCVLGLICWWII